MVDALLAGRTCRYGTNRCNVVILKPDHQALIEIDVCWGNEGIVILKHDERRGGFFKTESQTAFPAQILARIQYLYGRMGSKSPLDVLLTIVHDNQVGHALQYPGVDDGDHAWIKKLLVIERRDNYRNWFHSPKTVNALYFVNSPYRFEVSLSDALRYLSTNSSVITCG